MLASLGTSYWRALGELLGHRFSPPLRCLLMCNRPISPTFHPRKCFEGSRNVFLFFIVLPRRAFGTPIVVGQLLSLLTLFH